MDSHYLAPFKQFILHTDVNDNVTASLLCSQVLLLLFLKQCVWSIMNFISVILKKKNTHSWQLATTGYPWQSTTTTHLHFCHRRIIPLLRHRLLHDNRFDTRRVSHRSPRSSNVPFSRACFPRLHPNNVLRVAPVWERLISDWMC